MRFVVAASVAGVLTGLLLVSQYGALLFKDRRNAMWCWFGLVALDSAVSAVAVAAPLAVGQDEAGNFITWATVGCTVPLALRSPLKEDRQPLAGTGIFRWYERARSRLTNKLSWHVAELRRADTAQLVKEMTARGWTYTTLLGYVDACLEYLDEAAEGTKEEIREFRRLVYLAVGYSEEQLQIRHIAFLIVKHRVSSMRRHVTRERPTAAERHRGEMALVLANDAMVQSESSMSAQDALSRTVDHDVDLRDAAVQPDAVDDSDSTPTEAADDSDVRERPEHRRLRRHDDPPDDDVGPADEV